MFILKSTADFFYCGPMRGCWSDDIDKAKRFQTWSEARQYYETITRRSAIGTKGYQIIEEQIVGDTVAHADVTDSVFFAKSEAVEGWNE